MPLAAAASIASIHRGLPGAGIRKFTAEDGLLPGNPRVGFRDRHGALWFGGDHGLLRIEPQKDVLDSSQRSGPRHSSEWPHRVRSLLWEMPNLRRYRFPLPNGNSKWISEAFATIFFIRRASLAWIGTGHRHLLLAAFTIFRWLRQLRARDPRHDSRRRFSTVPARVHFHIAAPVWRRWWFLGLAALAVAAAAYAFYRYRVSRLLELERVRTRIASDLHDDIGANLTRSRFSARSPASDLAMAKARTSPRSGPSRGSRASRSLT